MTLMCMRMPVLKGLLSGLLGLAITVCSVATATTYLELTLDEMFDKADIAFFGEVIDSGSETRDGEPWTLITFRVARDLRGELATETTEDTTEISLAFYGGQADGVTLTVTDMPQFQRGEDVLILAYDADYYSPIVGFAQGLWRLEARGFTDSQGRVLTLELPPEDTQDTQDTPADADVTQAATLVRDGEGSERDSVLDAIEAALAGRP